MIATTLIQWFSEAGRALPWRQTRDPYRILVSEVMLQQTQVERVVPKYHAFLAQFPDIDTLAGAPTSAIITAWQGLGYNRRALYLQKTAQTVRDQYAGLFPRDVAVLRTLPGLGPYTAGAIACFAYEQDVAFMDVNIRRVAVRLWSDPQAIIPADQALVTTLATHIPAGQGWAFNQAIMELGATICTAKTPQCPRCPVRAACADYAGRRAADEQLQPIPVRVLKKVAEKPARPFIGSNRYFRGRIIDLLRVVPGNEGMPQSALHAAVVALGEPIDPAAFDSIVTKLASDGLVVRDGEAVRLPG